MATGGGKPHWDDVYERKAPHDVSWFQPSLRLSLDLLEGTGLPTAAHVIDVGGGASTLVDDLLGRGFRNLTVLDISGQALTVAQQRLGQRARGVTWIEGDITQTQLSEKGYDLWHD